MGGSELSGFVPFSSGYLPDFNSIRNNPNKDEVQHHIVQEVMRRVSMGGRAHLLAYEFDIGQLSDLNVDLEMRKKDGYNIRALSMVLASGIRMDRGLGNSSGGDARFVAPTIKLVYNPNRGLVLSSHWDEPLDKHPEVTDWFTNLQAA
jgi:hypothetical protein